MMRRANVPYLRLHRSDAVQLGDFAGHALYHARQDRMPEPPRHATSVPRLSARLPRREHVWSNPHRAEQQLARLLEERELRARQYMQACAAIAELTATLRDRERWEENHACRMLVEDAADIPRRRHRHRRSAEG